MKRVAFISCLTLAAIVLADPAWADVGSSFQAAGTTAVQWVRAGGLLIITVCGIMLVRGFQALYSLGAVILGLAIAIAPEQIMGLIG